MRKPRCRRAECRRMRVSPEIAAIVIAADRVVDVMGAAPSRSWWEHNEKSPELIALKRAVFEARAVREQQAVGAIEGAEK